MSKSSRQHTASVNYKLCFKTSWFESHEIFFSIFWFILLQAPNVWEDELHNIVQMGLNSSISLDGQDLDGITRKFTHISLSSENCTDHLELNNKIYSEYMQGLYHQAIWKLNYDFVLVLNDQLALIYSTKLHRTSFPVVLKLMNEVC